NFPERNDVTECGSLIKRNAHLLIVIRKLTQVVTTFARFLNDLSTCTGLDLNYYRVKKVMLWAVVISICITKRPHSFCKSDGQSVNALRNLLQPLRPMITSVERGHVCQQRLRRADVAGGLLA